MQFDISFNKELGMLLNICERLQQLKNPFDKFLVLKVSVERFVSSPKKDS